MSKSLRGRLADSLKELNIEDIYELCLKVRKEDQLSELNFDEFPHEKKDAIIFILNMCESSGSFDTLAEILFDAKDEAPKQRAEEAVKMMGSFFRNPYKTIYTINKISPLQTRRLQRSIATMITDFCFVPLQIFAFLFI